MSSRYWFDKVWDRYYTVPLPKNIFNLCVQWLLYLYELVGTLYLREQKYDKAVEWLSKVSTDYQNRTNLAKNGYFGLDPFRYQSKEQFISKSTDYKLRFGKEMARLEKVMKSSSNPNVRAEAKIRFAIGLRNSFGRCWYLTRYKQNSLDVPSEGYGGELYYSDSRETFKSDMFAQEAYRKADTLTNVALKEFTDSERAAKAHLEMMNFATIMKCYPGTRAAAFIRGRCDTYRDYALYKRY